MTHYITENEAEVIRILFKNGKSLAGKDFAVEDYNSIVEKLNKCGLGIESEVIDDENITDRVEPN